MSLETINPLASKKTIGLCLVFFLIVLLTFSYFLFSYWSEEQNQLRNSETLTDLIEYEKNYISSRSEELEESSCVNESGFESELPTCDYLEIQKYKLLKRQETLKQIEEKEDTDLALYMFDIEHFHFSSAYDKTILFMEGVISETNITNNFSEINQSYKPFSERDLTLDSFSDYERLSTSKEILKASSVKAYLSSYYPRFCEKHYQELIQRLKEGNFLLASFDLGIVEICERSYKRYNNKI